MTENTRVLDTLTTIFRDVLDDEEIVLSPDTTADDVDDWDSLAHVRLMIATQDKFRVKFSAADIGKLNSVGDLVALITRKLG